MKNQAVDIQNLSFSYGKTLLYRNFSLQIKHGGVLFVMGANGCGKTTLLKIIANILSAYQGKVAVFGRDLRDYDRKTYSKTVSYLPQISHLKSDFLVKDYLLLGRTPFLRFGEPPQKEDFEIVESCALKTGVQNLLKRPFATLSGGQKQMASIARCLAQQTPILIMDEPLSALDMGNQAEFLRLIVSLRQEGKTIILSAHNPNYALSLPCDVCFISGGAIVGMGTSQEIITEELLIKIYGDCVSLEVARGRKSVRIRI